MSTYRTNVELVTFEALEAGVLKGDDTCLGNYLEIGNLLAIFNSTDQGLMVYQRLYNTLLEVICDPLLPYFWRCRCRQEIQRPLEWMLSLEDSNRVRRLVFLMREELVTLSRYPLHPPKHTSRKLSISPKLLNSWGLFR